MFYFFTTHKKIFFFSIDLTIFCWLFFKCATFMWLELNLSISSAVNSIVYKPQGWRLAFCFPLIKIPPVGLCVLGSSVFSGNGLLIHKYSYYPIVSTVWDLLSDIICSKLPEKSETRVQKQFKVVWGRQYYLLWHKSSISSAQINSVEEETWNIPHTKKNFGRNIIKFLGTVKGRLWLRR